MICKKVVLRRAVLRNELRPVNIFMGDPPEPIQPDFVTISHAWHTHDPHLESYNLAFYKFDGTPITWEQFETLEIAIDQAWDIVGIKPKEWEVCEIKITDPEGKFPWSPEVQ